MQITGRQINLIYDINKEECTYAFRDIDICLNSREIVGIMGPSGCGKSSLLYVLSGMRKPTSGTVYYDDVDIEAYSVNEKAKIRKSKFAVDLDTEEHKEKAMDILESLKISHLAKRKPEQLSGGQKQRAAIARALMNNPEVIFADEPTASLDHNSALEIFGVLEQWKDRSTIIIATHDATILKNVDRRIELWDGCAISRV
jgi:putative ABC transport system ATP-binding protein